MVLLIIFRAILEQNCSVEVGVGSRGENLLKNFNCDSCGMEINFNGIIRKFTFLIVWAQSIGRSVFPPQAIFFLNNPQIFLNLFFWLVFICEHKHGMCRICQPFCIYKHVGFISDTGNTQFTIVLLTFDLDRQLSVDLWPWQTTHCDTYCKDGNIFCDILCADMCYVFVSRW